MRARRRRKVPFRGRKLFAMFATYELEEDLSF